MTEKDILRHHNALYDYLYSVHEPDSNSKIRFRVRRMNNKNRLDKGYWFNGNEKYLETSFWDYKDNLHQTSVIQLCYIFEQKAWYLSLVGRDSREREQYFEKMSKSLDIELTRQPNSQIWSKRLESNDFINTIKLFLDNGSLKKR